MPEGDTIYRSAAQLRLAIEGQEIAAADCLNRRFECPLPTARMVGQVCTRVEARGKHLLLHLASGDAIHSHMGMTGSWHLYRPGESWQKPRHYASLVLSCGSWDAICFTPKTLELLSADGRRRHPHLSQLGPDLMDPAFDLQTAAKRLAIDPNVKAGVAMMDQRLICGIGNVYKSEVLFLERLNPFAPIGAFTSDQLTRVADRARTLMLRNLDGTPRRTRYGGAERLWVYGRARAPCLKCGNSIQMQRQGDAGRSTYWCATCQYEPGAGASVGPE